MESIFTRMLEGKEPCVWLAQDAEYAAILEPSPAAPGHAVVFPKQPSDALFDLDADALGRLMIFSKKIAAALKAEIPCQKIALVVYGLRVRHVHVHLIPAQGEPGEITLDKPRSAADPAELARLAERIRIHI